jgi:predicted glycoside hydrolase/deacetylase ChbG (UPF0249 family)
VSGIQLIVNADDFGMSIGITDGICLAHRYGLVTSTSMIVNLPAADYALGRLDDVQNLGVGIHLNVCQGRPILPRQQVRSLVDGDGNFFSPAAMARKLTLFQVDAWELESEFRAQIQWFKRGFGEPTHADSHQHMHLYPGAVRAFARAIAAEEIPCVRASQCDAWMREPQTGGPHAGNLVRRLGVQMYRRLLQQTVLGGFDSPRSRICFENGARTEVNSAEAVWNSAFARLAPGSYELSCHPGLAQPGFSHADRIACQREQELRWLTSPEMHEAAERRAVELISYRDLCHRRSVACQVHREAIERRVG